MNKIQMAAVSDPTNFNPIQDIPETRLVPKGRINGQVAAAATAVADAGGSPRAQLDAARAEQRKINATVHLNYVSHQGKKQRMKNLERMAKAAAKAAAKQAT